MRPVVEGQRDAACRPRRAARCAGPRRSARGVRGRGRGRPRRGARAEREDGGTHGPMVAAMSASTGAGLAVAAAAAACYETGYAFQALEARGVGARHALRVSLIGRLVGNARWLGGHGALAARLAAAGRSPCRSRRWRSSSRRWPSACCCCSSSARACSASPSAPRAGRGRARRRPGSPAWPSPRPSAARSPAGPG